MYIWQVPLGALTSAGRDKWARARAHLLAFPHKIYVYNHYMYLYTHYIYI